MSIDSFMYEAIKEAEEGIRNGDGGPFGSIIVKNGEIVGRGHNRVLKNSDPTCHGEMEAIRDACKRLNTHDLSGCKLYTTAYPCKMCAGAIEWAGIKEVIYGCDVNDTEDIGFKDKEFYEDSPITFDCQGHDECRELFKDYQKTEPELY